MRVTTLCNKLLKLKGLWVSGFAFEEGDLVLFAQPRGRRMKCPHCGKSQSGKRSRKQRRWRHLGVWGATRLDPVSDSPVSLPALR